MNFLEKFIGVATYQGVSDEFSKWRKTAFRDDYSKCALSSSPDIGERSEGAISNTVLQP